MRRAANILWTYLTAGSKDMPRSYVIILILVFGYLFGADHGLLRLWGFDL